jgi:hypothetical protein
MKEDSYYLFRFMCIIHLFNCSDEILFIDVVIWRNHKNSSTHIHLPSIHPVIVVWKTTYRRSCNEPKKREKKKKKKGKSKTTGFATTVPHVRLRTCPGYLKTLNTIQKKGREEPSPSLFPSRCPNPKAPRSFPFAPIFPSNQISLLFNLLVPCKLPRSVSLRIQKSPCRATNPADGFR